jgi:hypothetical protein
MANNRRRQFGAQRGHSRLDILPGGFAKLQRLEFQQILQNDIHKCEKRLTYNS